MTDLWRLTLREAADGLARRDFSAAELLGSTLDRLYQTEATLHAYVTPMEGSARREAAAADKDLKRGRGRGPLHGIPVGVKDLFCTKGVATQAGSRVLEGFVPAYDATVVRKLKDAGAVIVGKTTTHEFAIGQNTPLTRNPWNTDCYPGGSSAGSGVSVAVGSAFAAIGTDTGGSIRIPAAVNGVVGLKPSYGRVSRYGVIPMSATLDTVGPLARTAEDCALMLGVIAGHDPMDPSCIEEPVPDYLAFVKDGIKGLRLGIERDYFFSYKHVMPEVRIAAEATIDQLCALGAEVTDVRLPELEHATAAGMVVLLADTSEWHRRRLRSHADKYVPATRVMLELGELLPAVQYVHAQRARAMVRERMQDLFAKYHLDGLVGPTLPMTTVRAEEVLIDSSGDGETALSIYVHHCLLGNSLGMPAISFPCGLSSDRLPLGFQVYGRPFEESILLRVAYAYQQVTDWHTLRPEPQLKHASALE